MYIREGIENIIHSDLPNYNLELICIEVQPLTSEPLVQFPGIGHLMLQLIASNSLKE